VLLKIIVYLMPIRNEYGRWYFDTLGIDKRVIGHHVTGGSSPRVRAYLYGALLYYLQIAQKLKPLHISLTGQLSYVSINVCANNLF